MTLVFQDAQGVESRLHLQVPVQRMAPKGGEAAGHGGRHARGGHQY